MWFRPERETRKAAATRDGGLDHDVWSGPELETRNAVATRDGGLGHDVWSGPELGTRNAVATRDGGLELHLATMCGLVPGLGHGTARRHETCARAK